MHQRDGVCKPCQKLEGKNERQRVLEIYKDTDRQVNEQLAEYGAAPTDVPYQTATRLSALHACETVEVAIPLAQMILQKNRNSLIMAWSSGKVKGKVTEQSLEAKIKSAESLVKMLTDKDAPPEQVEKQRQRVDKLRQELEAMSQSRVETQVQEPAKVGVPAVKNLAPRPDGKPRRMTIMDV